MVSSHERRRKEGGESGERKICGKKSHLGINCPDNEEKVDKPEEKRDEKSKSGKEMKKSEKVISRVLSSRTLDTPMSYCASLANE